MGMKFQNSQIKKIASKSHTFWIHNLQKISQFSNSEIGRKLHNFQIHKL